ncbi:TRAP transporter small permease protein [Salimicrobium jeotgali]|uniref:TRAP transporter small permease protein n=1 Tax=Salimicrobium jeotgali TaxID=1230341 RepID=K2FLT0_9BACI|nr:TRAP transporter small permease [Salimicrobium jeotgali]AKG03662.1 TRAP transporter small permease protein [Salimicrobium jeotgali]EKE31951.1 TRAP-T type transporter subunit DctQ [Salimicrobium jeotgali]MBM7696135.1 TRAP-type C4-dicarboxylate transport system permease small subunit [Salimicrobium jeotgali]
MKLFRALDRGILKLEEFILSYAVILIALMVISKPITRTLLGYTLPFADEVSQISVTVATFMGISYAARKGRHISMSAFYDLSPFKVRKVLSIFIPALTAAILFVLAYYSTLYVLDIKDSGRVTAALQMPMYILYMFIPIGFSLGGVQFLRNMWVNIRDKENVYIGTEALDYNDMEDEKVEETGHL